MQVKVCESLLEELACEVISKLAGDEGEALGQVLPSSLEYESPDLGKLVSFEQEISVKHRGSVSIVTIVI